MRILTEAKLVSIERVGREKRYNLQPETLLELKEWLAYYERFWDNKLAKLKYIVEKGEE